MSTNKEKQIAAEKISKYKEFIKALKDEKRALQKGIDEKLYTDLQISRAQQRIFDIDITIEGHQEFIKAYTKRLN